MPRLSFPVLTRFYLPLALSGLLMTLQQPVVAGAISRTAGARESLAAYGLVLSVAVFLESPIYQGVLIGRGQTRAVGYGTAGRLIVMAITAFSMVYLAGWPGSAAGTGALMVGALAEALFGTGWLRLAENKPDEILAGFEPLTLSRLGRFYWPLALTSVLVVLSWPLTNAGKGRAAAPTQSLAAWPVVLSVLWLFTTCYNR